MSCRGATRSIWATAIGAACILGVAATVALAHPGVSAVALVKVDSSGRVTITLRHDALAFALNDTPQRIDDDPMYALLDGPAGDLEQAFAAGRSRFLALFELAADGQRIPVELAESPTASAARIWRAENPGRRLPLKLDFVAVAQISTTTREITLLFPEVLGNVILTLDRPDALPFTMPLLPGTESSPFELSVATAASGPATATSEPAPSDSHHAVAPPLSPLRVAWRYLVFGFTHILPDGPDHVLFVMGLFFLSPKLKPLLWQVTAFTLAHSITLALSILNVVSLPASIVEPIIAASIAFVAIENVFTTRLHAWRPVIVFLFGLIHGLGFAGVLRELGLPRGELAAALVSFNVGVELGQLAVIALALLLVGRWRKRQWYRRSIAIPASLLIAAVGVYWTAMRLGV